MHTHAYKHTYIQTYIHTHACKHTHIHAYIHTYRHKCMHTYIHTYITYIHQKATRLDLNLDDAYLAGSAFTNSMPTPPSRCNLMTSCSSRSGAAGTSRLRSFISPNK